MTAGFRIAELAKEHDRSGFDCGSPELNRYLSDFVGQDSRRRLMRCYVVLPPDSPKVAGYYTLSATAIDVSDLPDRIARKMPRYGMIPAVLIGRLAIGLQFQGQQLGAVLIADAIKRVLKLEIGAAAIVVDAKDEKARRFYERFEFNSVARDERRLVLPLIGYKPD